MNLPMVNRFSRKMTTAVLVFFLAALIGAPEAVLSQDRENVPPRPELRKWSLQVYGGSFTARTGTGFTPFSGSTGVNSGWVNPAFGAGIEYMFNPSLAANVRYVYTMIENDDGLPSYENTYQSVSFGLSLYLLSLTNLDKGHSWFSPYVSLNIGYGQSEWTNLEGRPDRDATHGHYGFGLGTRIRLGSALDLSLDYMYHQFNQGYHVDGYNIINGIRDNDRVAGFMAGLVFNMGSSRRPHARWYSPVPATQEWRRSVDSAISGREDDWDRILADLDRQDARLAQLNREMQDKASQGDLEQARRTIEVLEAQLNDMGSQFDSDIQRIDRIHEAAGIAHLTPTLEPGFYIQTYAAWSTRFTHRALEMTRDGLIRRGYETDRLSFFVYQLPNGLYTVQIGDISSLDQANDVLTGVLDIFDDAFIHQHVTER
ncbi:MAG: hypothetical protein EA363_10080 [Balneolaceae bacterium]|nr:MAG: hypothetical protein EA363_10080 [Balneolaceae bacterium]